MAQMYVRMKLDGVKSVQKKLRARMTAAKTAGTPQYHVEYGDEKVRYAIYVHERLDVHHQIGQAKFLEAPARRERLTMLMMVANVVRAGGTLRMGLLAAARFLLRVSRMVTPIDTGALRRSGRVVRYR